MWWYVVLYTPVTWDSHVWLSKALVTAWKDPSRCTVVQPSVHNLSSNCNPSLVNPCFFLIIILRVSKVWSILHHGSIGQTLHIFLAFFFLFSWKNCVLIIFISFSDKVSNSRSRILTNEKPGLVIRNCQWICMLLFLYDSFCRVFFLWFVSIFCTLSFWFVLSFWQTVFFVFINFFLSSFPCLFLSFSVVLWFIVIYFMPFFFFSLLLPFSLSFTLSFLSFHFSFFFYLLLLFFLSFLHLHNSCTSYLRILQMVSKHFCFFTKTTSRPAFVND